MFQQLPPTSHCAKHTHCCCIPTTNLVGLRGILRSRNRVASAGPGIWTRGAWFQPGAHHANYFKALAIRIMRMCHVKKILTVLRRGPGSQQGPWTRQGFVCGGRSSWSRRTVSCVLKNAYSTLQLRKASENRRGWRVTWRSGWPGPAGCVDTCSLIHQVPDRTGCDSDACPLVGQWHGSWRCLNLNLCFQL